MKLVVFDVETKKAFDEVGGYKPEKLGVSISGVFYCDDARGESWFKGYREEQFTEMFKVFEQADRIVGFNIIDFDYPALSPYYAGTFEQFNSLDVMAEVEKVVGYRVGLDAIAKETLGIQKSGKGLDALEYYRDRDWEKLEKYCLRDVEVTRDLYTYGLNNKELRFKNKWNRLITVPVDFAMKETAKSSVQTTLF